MKKKDAINKDAIVPKNLHKLLALTAYSTHADLTSCEQPSEALGSLMAQLLMTTGLCPSLLFVSSRRIFDVH